MKSLQHVDEAIEITCHNNRAVIYDNKTGRYFETSAEAIQSHINEWQQYKSQLPENILYLYFVTFVILLAGDFVWFLQSDLQINVKTAPAFAIFLVINVAAHELAHVVALHLCGRKVDKIGFKLNYKLLPAFYVRMNQVLLLNWKEKLFCHSAGLFINLLTIQAVIILNTFIDISPCIISSAWIFLTMLIMNIIPVLNTDGQKALCVMLSVSDPKDKSKSSYTLRVIHVISSVFLVVIVARFLYVVTDLIMSVGG